MERVVKKDKVNTISFNQDYTCFSIATDTGFKIYTTHPFKMTVSRDLEGSLYMASMLYRCNIVGLVGGGSHPKYAPNKLILWDDLNHKVTGELTFAAKVKEFKLRRDIIAVALIEKVMVFNLLDLGNLFNTFPLFSTFKHFYTKPNVANFIQINMEC